MAHTKASVLTLARNRWGKDGFIEESRNAPTKEQREATVARAIAIRERKEQIDAEQKRLGPNYPALLKACRFVVDVDGDDPSIGQLRKELEHAEKAKSLMDERQALDEERKGLWLGYRWQAGHISHSVIRCRVIEVQADTLDELAEKIGGRGDGR